MPVDVVDGLVPGGPALVDGAEAVPGLVRHEAPRVELNVDTHPHAEHVTASAVLRRTTGAPRGIDGEALPARWREGIALLGERVTDLFEERHSDGARMLHGLRSLVADA